MTVLLQSGGLSESNLFLSGNVFVLSCMPHTISSHGVHFINFALNMPLERSMDSRDWN
jgi:hypothetical protein